MTRKLSSLGSDCFGLHLNAFGKLSSKANNVSNPAVFLYENGARNILFRLEALARIYKSAIGKKFFKSLDKDFKKLEDILGTVDYYDSFLKEFIKQKNISPDFLRYFRKGRVNSFSALNNELKLKEWIGIKPNRIEKIKRRLPEMNWPQASKERNSICEFLIEEIDKLVSQYKNGKIDFDKIENGIHEFRRKLRWISIYAASLNGMIQLKKIKVSDPALKKYLTPEVLNSPFNIFPKPPAGIKPIYIQSPYFYALSWMIDELGRLKDAGLKIEVIREALDDSGIRSAAAKKEITKQLLSKNNKKQSEISAQVEIIVDEFLYENKVLEKIKRDLFRNMN